MIPLIPSDTGPAPVSITQVELLSDRLRVHFHCQRPWGTADEDGVREVLLSSISALPCVSAEGARGASRDAWEEAVPVPTLGVTLLFRFAQWQETDDCRMVGLVGGPYRVLPAPGPFA
jgi:hypothetical protein